MPKCDFSKVVKQLYGNRTSVWLFSYKLVAYFQNTFSWQHLWVAASEFYMNNKFHTIKIFSENIMVLA